MSSAFRSSIGLAAVAAAGVVLAGTGFAAAQGLGNSRAYVKVFGGVTLPQDDGFTLVYTTIDPASSGLDYDSGYVFGIAGGYNVAPNVAIELEFSYRAADADLTTSATDSASGGTTVNAYMANAVYTFPPIDAAGAVRPFVGVGLGAADFKYDPDGGGRLGGDFKFAYQAIAGIGYQMNESWTLSGEVRFLGASENDVSSATASFKTTYQTFDALVGATYRF
ncbi:MAG: porin family protein [Amaricoccus sp.]|uniref:outer membrane protein n=1 Tax=Amaricoccus sp. TaxID=1872485 RepID=UPI0039E64814